MNTFEATNYYFRQAAQVMELSERVQHLLINPDREVKVEVSIQLDNGELAIFDAYRIQHNDSRRPRELSPTVMRLCRGSLRRRALVCERLLIL